MCTKIIMLDKSWVYFSVLELKNVMFDLAKPSRYREDVGMPTGHHHETNRGIIEVVMDKSWYCKSITKVCAEICSKKFKNICINNLTSIMFLNALHIPLLFLSLYMGPEVLVLRRALKYLTDAVDQVYGYEGPSGLEQRVICHSMWNGVNIYCDFRVCALYRGKIDSKDIRAYSSCCQGDPRL
jgi:hypothetical protein